MSKVNNSDKILSLQKHLEKVKYQQHNPSPKYKDGKLTAHKAWLTLEIKRTQLKIDQLKGVA